LNKLIIVKGKNGGEHILSESPQYNIPIYYNVMNVMIYYYLLFK